jgi:SAM-dependent methyltransferase
MHLDVVDLKAFYYRTSLGRAAQKAIRDRVVEFWPDVSGDTVAGFGFAAPMLRPFLGSARRVISLMPGPQGVMPWPEGGDNYSVLCEETLWPLPTGFVDRLVVLHGLETSEEPSRLLDEIWRVLAPGGRVLFIVPNRSGLWARRDVTPFGFGRPYSLHQLETQLQRHRFLAERHLAALYAPPSQKRFWLRAAPIWERVGQKVSSVLASGVIMIEASKQIYAPTQRGHPARVPSPLKVLGGIARPVPKPAPQKAGQSGRETGADPAG